MLSDSEKKTLLSIAREAIVHLLNGEQYTPKTYAEAALTQHSGCFVTITQNGQLRGCIGNFQSQQPLYLEVSTMAVAAASQDPRFPPLSHADLDNFSLEITVLSPLEKIDNVNQIEVGKHGIYIIKRLNRGVLLPQVATEYGWDREMFLRQTCAKAGLVDDAWQHPDAEIYIFSGQIFHE